jgi:hypothetical protein
MISIMTQRYKLKRHVYQFETSKIRQRIRLSRSIVSLNAKGKGDEVRRWNASRTSQLNGSSITYQVYQKLKRHDRLEKAFEL